VYETLMPEASTLSGNETLVTVDEVTQAIKAVESVQNDPLMADALASEELKDALTEGTVDDDTVHKLKHLKTEEQESAPSRKEDRKSKKRKSRKGRKKGSRKGSRKSTGKLRGKKAKKKLSKSNTSGFFARIKAALTKRKKDEDDEKKSGPRKRKGKEARRKSKKKSRKSNKLSRSKKSTKRSKR